MGFSVDLGGVDTDQESAMIHLESKSAWLGARAFLCLAPGGRGRLLFWHDTPCSIIRAFWLCWLSNSVLAKYFSKAA